MSGLREALVELADEWGRYGPMAPEAWQILDGIRVVLDGHPVPEAVTLTEAEREDVARAAGYAVGGYLATHDLYPAVERVLDARLSAPTMALGMEAAARRLFEWDIEDHPEPKPAWEDLVEQQREVWRDGARAVVAADRRRTEAEVKAEERERIVTALRAKVMHVHDNHDVQGECPDGCGWMHYAARIAEGGEG